MINIIIFPLAIPELSTLTLTHSPAGFSINCPDPKTRFMERNDIKTKVLKVISEVLDTEGVVIGEDDNFVFDLGADSMQSLQLVAGFEEEFNIEMDEDKALEVQTVGAAVDFIAQYV